MSFEKLYLELTSKCNLTCKICYRQGWQETLQDLDFSLLEKIYQETKGLNLKEIVLGGIGEPLFYPYIKETLNLFSRFNLTLTTNGTLLKNELLEMVATKISKVVVSIDGSFKTYEKIRGYPLNEVLNNLKALNNIKQKLKSELPFLSVEFVLSKENQKELLKMVEICAEIKADQLIISQLVPQTEVNKNKILYKKYNNQKLKSLLEKVKLYALKKGLKLVIPKVELKTERFCPFIEEKALVVGADGKVYPCYRFSHSMVEYIFGRKKEVFKHSFGDLREKSLIEIFNTSSYQDFRYRIYANRYPSCIDCDLIDGCELVKTSECDCYALMPSCGDCLWSRGFAICP
ncbi:tungsten cofactor oxidoreductase radical SAM maturase [Thermodesulfobacterium sp. TA1]|uniref:tungsten cofactor oxidoreductase radical SAM maturase n=1 Tax=Thermodesulfobacterium sp. TA1 TaxID=2234087 RepID=UPI0012327AFC|nr:tungsten cofactor oxidoreductase radical SAM maturase [Thermodesulfobacterium sp. TA1]QER41922.1 tungsten cofactor oxidoreductase radical SAM maturase [Thermodesulfobacterium sp. TA1]